MDLLAQTRTELEARIKDRPVDAIYRGTNLGGAISRMRRGKVNPSLVTAQRILSRINLKYRFRRVRSDGKVQEADATGFLPMALDAIGEKSRYIRVLMELNGLPRTYCQQLRDGHTPRLGRVTDLCRILNIQAEILETGE